MGILSAVKSFFAELFGCKEPAPPKREVEKIT
jgi:hypothetical protein